MPELDTTAWYAFGVPLYLALVAVEAALGRRRRVRVFNIPETISNLTAGLGTLLIGLFVGPYVLRAWDFVCANVAPYRWPPHGAWRLPAALVLADFCYYAYHRAGHRFAVFWAIHGIHHQHEHQNSSVAFRLEWLADPYAALFFGLMPLAGVDSTTGFAAIALLSLYTLTAHAPTLARRTFGFLITPAIHGAHHSRDARYAESNYGAMLGVWDRLFGTWREPPPGDVLRADLPSISRTHNGVSAQWGLVLELLRELRAAPSLRAALSRLTARPTVTSAPSPLREEREIHPATLRYAVAQFCALSALALWVLWFRADRGLSVPVVATTTVLAGFWAIGELLDGAPRAARNESWRLAGSIAVSAWLVPRAPFAAAWLAGTSLVGLFALSNHARAERPLHGCERP